MEKRNVEIMIESERQLQKLLALNELVNVAKRLNDGWEPNWDNEYELKHFFDYNKERDRLLVNVGCIFAHSSVYFKNEELAEQAIDILGEETIKLAVGENW